jgi:hypothetical protein
VTRLSLLFALACANPAPPGLVERCRQASSPAFCGALAREAEAAARPDLARAAWEAACDQGDGAACAQAARAWDPVDPFLAAVHRRAACDLGQGESCVDLAGQRLTSGDEGAALALLTQACGGPDPRACNDLGVRLVSDSARQDLGRLVLKEACRREVWAACGNLGRLARDGRTEPANLEKGTKLLSLACTRGDASACLDLGDLASKSSAPSDRQLAVKMYEQACFQDNATACERAATTVDPNDTNQLARIRARGCGLGKAALCDGGSTPGAPLPPPPALPPP